MRDFIFRKGDIDRTISCPEDKKVLYECTLTGEEEDTKEKEEGAGGDGGSSDGDREYYGRRYADKFEENEVRVVLSEATR